MCWQSPWQPALICQDEKASIEGVCEGIEYTKFTKTLNNYRKRKKCSRHQDSNQRLDTDFLFVFISTKLE